MASYKKKNIKKLQPTRESRSVNIDMTPSKKARIKNIKQRPSPDKLKVLVGGKTKRRSTFTAIFAIAILFGIAYLIITLLHPIGLSEYVSSSFKISAIFTV